MNKYQKYERWNLQTRDKTRWKGRGVVRLKVKVCFLSNCLMGLFLVGKTKGIPHQRWRGSGFLIWPRKPNIKTRTSNHPLHRNMWRVAVDFANIAFGLCFQQQDIAPNARWWVGVEPQSRCLLVGVEPQERSLVTKDLQPSIFTIDNRWADD